MPNALRLSDFHRSRARFVIRQGKTGKHQFVLLIDEVLLRPLLHFTKYAPSQNYFLFSLSSSSLASSFHSTLRLFHLDKVGYTVHSLLHGDATWEWLNGQLLEDIMPKRQWSFDKSCKYSFNAEKTLQVRSSLPTVFNTILHKFTSYWCATAVVVRAERPCACHWPDPFPFPTNQSWFQASKQACFSG